jgi:transcriptional regulator with XRE-family HTH domain
MDPIPVIAPVTDRPMTQDEKQFFRQLGGRIASLRKEQGFTQAQFAGVLGLTQQIVASYEVGRRRVPVSLLPKTLIGQGRATPAKRGPAPKLQQRMERIQRLPRAKQRLVLEMLDGVLAQASR